MINLILMTLKKSLENKNSIIIDDFLAMQFFNDWEW